MAQLAKQPRYQIGDQVRAKHGRRDREVRDVGRQGTELRVASSFFSPSFFQPSTRNRRRDIQRIAFEHFGSFGDPTGRTSARLRPSSPAVPGYNGSR